MIIILACVVLAFCIQFVIPDDLGKQKTSTPYTEYKFQHKVNKQQEKEIYEKDIRDESGYQLVEEYEEKSKEVPLSEKSVAHLPAEAKPSKMKYVPQPTYELARYNTPPGSVEAQIHRSFHFDRHENLKGITAPDFSIMVYPTMYYYATNQCTACDLFVVPLDQSLPNIQKIQKADLAKRWSKPILSTDKDIETKFTFRSITPVDFSVDGTRLVAKEKVGNVHDGIWKTSVLVYDFTTMEGKKLDEVREAIIHYWNFNKGVHLEEYRWDIYPLGFSADNPEKVIVSAYAFTGRMPRFLGSWSVDVDGERCELVTLDNAEIVPVSVIGFTIKQNGVVPPADIKASTKRAKKVEKAEQKKAKKEKKEKLKARKKEYKAKIKEMNKEYRKNVREYKKRNRKSHPTS